MDELDELEDDEDDEILRVYRAKRIAEMQVAPIGLQLPSTWSFPCCNCKLTATRGCGGCRRRRPQPSSGRSITSGRMSTAGRSASSRLRCA